MLRFRWMSRARETLYFKGAALLVTGLLLILASCQTKAQITDRVSVGIRDIKHREPEVGISF